MRKILNTLYITTETAYISLDGENVVVKDEDREIGRLPIHTIDGIMVFSYVGASPALMGKCAEMNKSLVFLKPNGKFLAKITGKCYGNILLRREQYRLCDDTARSLEIARNMVSAKIANCSSVAGRAIRDHALRIDNDRFAQTVSTLQKAKVLAYNAKDSDTLRGLEGECACRYFSLFEDMILQQKEDFFFKGRSRRPPLDNTNALLSFSYSMLTSTCVSALEAVGLDPYAGVFHTERPGRCALALDLVEEFRAPIADRIVLTAINKKIITGRDFVRKETGGVILTDEGRKAFLTLFQQKKREEITHPFLQEKIEIGLLPYVQAMLLAKSIRGDLDNYPPYLWK